MWARITPTTRGTGLTSCGGSWSSLHSLSNSSPYLLTLARSLCLRLCSSLTISSSKLLMCRTTTVVRSWRCSGMMPISSQMFVRLDSADSRLQLISSLSSPRLQQNNKTSQTTVFRKTISGHQHYVWCWKVKFQSFLSNVRRYHLTIIFQKCRIIRYPKISSIQIHVWTDWKSWNVITLDTKRVKTVYSGPQSSLKECERNNTIDEINTGASSVCAFSH